MIHDTTSSRTADDLEAMVAVLESSGRYRVLRRIEPLKPRDAPAEVRTRLGLFVDVETTGLDPAQHEIIELAMTPFTYGINGEIYAVGEAFQQLRQPSRPIPPEITAITGIDDAMVEGHSIDPQAVSSFAAPAALVIAHNAAFDRKFLERYCGMHVDLTPAVLLSGRPERESTIFHHRAETPEIPGRHVNANPYGFAEWFKANTPPEALFGTAFSGYQAMDRAMAKAQTEPLPDQLKPHETSRALLSLQLTKRFRNLRYSHREQRCPPGVVLSKMVAEHKVYESGFAVALLCHVIHMRDEFRAAQQSGQLYHAVNPACSADVLTDRWPGTLADQGLWCRDLDHYVTRLTLYIHGSPTLVQRQAILADLFGEKAAKSAVLDFAERMGRDKDADRSRFAPGSGRLVVPATPAILTPTRGRAEPRTSYYGGEVWWRR